MMIQTAGVPSSKGKTGTGLLRNRPYLALMISQLISNLGDWLNLLALLTLVGIKWNATSWQVTAVMLCMVLPMLLGGPPAGWLADRVERKTLMILSDLARVVIVLGLVFVTALWQVYLLLILKGMCDVAFSPAKSGKIKEVVAPEHIEKAVSYSAIIEQGSKIVGPALGGLLTAAIGMSACFMIDSFSFLLSAIILLGVPGKNIIGEVANADHTVSSGKSAGSGFWKEMAAGLKIIAGVPMLAYGTLALCMVLLVLQISDSQIVVLFRGIQGIPEEMLGWCVALSGFGSLAAIGLAGLLRAWSPLLKMGAGGFVLGAVIIIAGIVAIHGPFNPWGYVMLAGSFFIAGLGAGMTFIPFQVLLQQRTPEKFTGRVFGSVTSITSAAAVFGPLCGGYLVTLFGPAPAFMLSGGLVGAISLLLLLSIRRINRLERSVAEAAPAA